MINNIELYSFDIFDTLITRKVAKPTGIFVLMQHIINTDDLFKNFPLDIKANFYQYRTDAEYYLRRINNQWHNGIDITFDEIYCYIQKNYNLTQEQIDKIKALEVKLEIESVVPIKENIEYVKELLKNNLKVVLISDMYLPVNVIKQMLYNADPILSTLKLYLSSELKYMKKDAELFKYVKKQENIEYKNWTHFGDNVWADYSKPKKLGIDAILYDYVDFEKYEEELLKNEFYNPAVQLILGCTKNLRLNHFAQNAKANLGASLTGVILYPYISWLLKQSQKHLINRLYFIARDGYILKEIADVLIKQNNLKLKTNYTYGSRKAWRLTGLDINNENLYKQFIDMFKYESKNIHFILNIDKNKLTEMLPKNLNKYYKLKNRAKMIDFFTNNKEIVIEAINNNEQQKLNTLCYLKNNIDYSDENFAFVDLDGSCLTQNCLASLFKDFYSKPIKSFYYAITPLCYEPINLEKYCFTTFKRPMLGCLTELLARAPHGQTLGYDDKGNPILEQINMKALENWGFDKYKQGILEFIFCISEYAKQYDYVSFETQKIMNFYLEYLFDSPDKKTANLLGELVHTADGSEINEFAPQINIFGAIKYLFTNRSKSENIKFSQARSHKLVRKIIEYKVKHPNLRKQIINILINHNSKEAKLTILGLTISFRSLLWGKTNEFYKKQ